MEYKIFQNQSSGAGLDLVAGLFGLVDHAGKVVIECKYSHISTIKNYSDLSLKNFSIIYLLWGGGGDNTFAYFSHIENNNFIGYPKLSFTEYLRCCEKLGEQYSDKKGELSFYWKDSINFNIVNNDFFPSSYFMLKIYKNLLNN